ncbi:MAG: response regulator [Elusimicrobia bacterium]|nr:response regulator [Elusimicrobiota bacterium]
MSEERDALVVDDEPVIVGAVARILRAEGLGVDAAASGAEGLALLAERPYRVAICDLMMTGMDGFAFLAAAARRRPGTPVVMTTGYATVETAVRSLTLGAEDFVPKPFTADELLAVVRRTLRRRALTPVPAGAGPRDTLPFVPCPAAYHRLGFVSWVKPEDEGTALVGLNDLFLKTVDGVARVELAAPGDEAAQGRPCAAVVSAAGDRHSVMCPLSGRIVAANRGAAESPRTLEKDPYFEGWLYRVVPTDLASDLKRLIPCSSDRL